MKKWLNEFKAFAKRGNVIDVAVGFAIAAAFGKIVSSLVADVIMPPIGVLMGEVDFNNLFYPLDGKHYATLEAAKEAGASVINLGAFVKNTVDFILIALVLFVIVTVYNRFLRKNEPKPATTKDCQFCYSKIAIKATRCPNCTSEVEVVEAE